MDFLAYHLEGGLAAPAALVLAYETAGLPTGPITERLAGAGELRLSTLLAGDLEDLALARLRAGEEEGDVIGAFREAAAAQRRARWHAT